MSDDLTTSLTLKYPETKRYEGAPWVVFKGSVGQIKDQVVAYFGYDQNQIAGMTMHEITLLANQSIRAAGSFAINLGATPITQESEQQSWGNPQGAPDGAVKGSAVWDQVEGGGNTGGGAPSNPHAGLIGLLNEAATIEDLKRLWVTNKPAFEDKAVAEAYSARGKALKAAA